MMRWTQMATIMCGAGLLACGGEERAKGDAGGAAGQSAAANQPAAPGGAAGTAAGGAEAGQPATGTTHEVKMLGDAQGYRFEPKALTIRAGDAVRWTLVSGPPHNVSFWPDSIPQDAASQLQANMPETTAPLTGPLRMTPGESYTVSFAGVPAGKYGYYCLPHLAMGMVARLTVQ